MLVEANSHKEKTKSRNRRASVELFLKVVDVVGHVLPSDVAQLVADYAKAPVPVAFSVPVLDTQPWLRHGFWTRHAGYSKGIFASLNCSLKEGDGDVAVRLNRALVLNTLGFPSAPLILPTFAHGNGVVVVDEKLLTQFKEHQEMNKKLALPPSDALVTNLSGVVLAVFGADCAPLLLADPKAKVIGAAHCGWKGVKSGVAEATIREMITLGAKVEDIVCGIGAYLGPKSYEVDLAFKDTFIQDDPKAAEFFSPSPLFRDKLLFDMGGALKSRLLARGILPAHLEQIEYFDTFLHESLWFSHRRSVKRKEPTFGNHIATIAKL